MTWWIGCSGFYYKGWRERFYPQGLAQKKWFEYYCQFFNTVELNVTFYRFPKLEALQGWFERSPEQFKFTVKAPRLITHYKRFNNAKREATEFYDVVAKGLQHKLGCVLFQLHPQLTYSVENINKILDTLDPAFTNVIEFRHASWWNEDVYKILDDRNITFCSISYPELPDSVLRTSSVFYYRFHGVPNLYLSSYTDDQLVQIARQIRQTPGVSETYCYFNNDIEVAAVYNAKTLQEFVSKDVWAIENIIPR